MARTLFGLQGVPRLSEAPWRLFGVRHLSPAASFDLLALLEAEPPERILVEGPEDADALIPLLVSNRSTPPLAILAFTAERPVSSILYPLAEYSPEYVVLKWAAGHGVPAGFMDLPTRVFLAMESPGGARAPAEDPAREALDPYGAIAKAEGFDDYETWWEYRFEHNRNPRAFSEAAAELGRGLRSIEEARERDLARERRMRAHIARALSSVSSPERLLVVAGAFHLPALGDTEDAMDDGELAALPSRESRLSLMPYSYARLASRSGYGAGNRAPAHYSRLWRLALEGRAELATDEYLASLAASLRAAGLPRSTADVIEATRLAETLAALRGGPAPSVADLRDAATAVLGRGETIPIAKALALAEIGTEIGRMEESAGRSSVQEDFYRELGELSLSRYLAATPETLDLDLRENRRAAGRESAFLDLRRSAFLWRLSILGVDFAQARASRQDSGTWAEAWLLRWTPEAEVSLAESSIYGDTVEAASAYLIQERLDGARDVAETAALAALACRSGLESSLLLAFTRLEAMGIETSDFLSLAGASWSVSLLVDDGALRRLDAEAALPLLRKLFLAAALRLEDAASCDRAAAKEVVAAMKKADEVALVRWRDVDGEVWEASLRRLALRDDRNPLLSGFAASTLLEKGRLAGAELALEMGRRLSPAMPADLGAAWFEGLALRNRLGLLSRLELWRSLADYVDGLDEGNFMRALVYLRRAFADFAPGERRMICENLGELWKAAGGDVEEALAPELGEEEKARLAALNDFDFDDV